MHRAPKTRGNFLGEERDKVSFVMLIRWLSDLKLGTDRREGGGEELVAGRLTVTGDGTCSPTASLQGGERGCRLNQWPMANDLITFP